MAGRWTLAVMVALAITLVAMALGGAEGLSPFVRRALRQELREGRGMGELAGTSGCSANQNMCTTEQAYQSFTNPSCCGNACVDLDANPYNCGSCGTSCPWGFSCSKGQCCDLQTDSQNCGTVGHKCQPGVKCELGMCGYAH